MPADPRTSIVVLTHNRRVELLHCLQQLCALPEQPPLVVVDNASTDGTAAVLQAHPGVRSVRCADNLGAAGRNAGVALVSTRYVAFCDDDTWWAPGALTRAADALDAHPRVAAVAARVLIGPERRTDPTCLQMADSPLDAAGLPGPSLTGFMAGAVVMRRSAFCAAGGYEPRFFLGAEEALLGLDLLARGWKIVYLDDVVTHHHPSRWRDPDRRRGLHVRNLLWLAWLRLPLAGARMETERLLRDNGASLLPGAPLRMALAGLPWVLCHRRVLPPAVYRDYLAVRRHVLSPQAQPPASRSVAESTEPGGAGVAG